MDGERCFLCGASMAWEHHLYSWPHYAAQAHQGGLWPSALGWARWLKLEGWNGADVLQVAMDSAENDTERQQVTENAAAIQAIFEEMP